MARQKVAGVVRYLRGGGGGDGAACPTDAELLERFVDGRDQAAFELLVWRHERMVLAVCRRVLRDGHDAEDAFQATFLVLARRAGSVGRGQAVGSWLYKVAYRCALGARARIRRSRGREQYGLDPSDAAAEDEGLIHNG